MTVARIPDQALNGPKDPGPGKHLWVVAVAFKVSDEAVRQMAAMLEPESQILDHENVIDVQGPGCYKCEREFTPRLYRRKCTGSMR